MTRVVLVLTLVLVVIIPASAQVAWWPVGPPAYYGYGPGVAGVGRAAIYGAPGIIRAAGEFILAVQTARVMGRQARCEPCPPPCPPCPAVVQQPAKKTPAGKDPVVLDNRNPAPARRQMPALKEVVRSHRPLLTKISYTYPR